MVASGLMLTGGATAASATTGSPVAERVSPQKDYPRMPRSCVDPKDLIPQAPGMCKLTAYRKVRPTVVLWGDSHAWQMIPALKAATKGRNVNLVAYVMGGCPPMDPQLNTPKKRRKASSCQKSNDQALRYVMGRKNQKLKTKVVIGGAWNRYLTPLRNGTPPEESYAAAIAQQLATNTPRLFRRLGARRVSTDVIGQSLEVPATASCARGRTPFVCSLPRRQALQSERDNKLWVKDAMTPLGTKARYISTNGAVCTRTLCRGKIKGIYTFYDDLHLSATRSRTLARFFKRSVGDVAPR